MAICSHRFFTRLDLRLVGQTPDPFSLGEEADQAQRAQLRLPQKGCAAALVPRTPLEVRGLQHLGEPVQVVRTLDRLCRLCPFP